MIEIVQGELAEQDTDAVLRPIRSDLSPVTTAARDVGKRAGATVEDRLEATGRVPVGGAVLTPAGALAASFLIHAVVMSMDEPESRATVERALGNGLARARDWGVASLSLPPFGLGAGSMDPEESARAFLDVLRGHIETGEPPQELRVVATSEFERDLLTRMLG